MKITKRHLRKIIKEEVQSLLEGNPLGGFFADEDTGMTIGPESAIQRAAEWIEPILQKKSSSLSDKFINRVKRVGDHRLTVGRRRLPASFETDVDDSGDRLRVTLAPKGLGGPQYGGHWLTLFVDTPIKIDKDKIRFAVHVRAESGGGDKGYASTFGRALWDSQGHSFVAEELRDAMLRHTAKGFPKSAGMDPNTDPSYPLYITVAEDVDSNDAAFRLLQSLYTPVVEIWDTLLFGNTIPHKINFKVGVPADHLDRVDVDTVPDIEKFWTTFQSLIRKF